MAGHTVVVSTEKVTPGEVNNWWWFFFVSIVLVDQKKYTIKRDKALWGSFFSIFIWLNSHDQLMRPKPFRYYLTIVHETTHIHNTHTLYTTISQHSLYLWKNSSIYFTLFLFIFFLSLSCWLFYICCASDMYALYHWRQSTNGAGIYSHTDKCRKKERHIKLALKSDIVWVYYDCGSVSTQVHGWFNCNNSRITSTIVKFTKHIANRN